MAKIVYLRTDKNGTKCGKIIKTREELINSSIRRAKR